MCCDVGIPLCVKLLADIKMASFQTAGCISYQLVLHDFDITNNRESIFIDLYKKFSPSYIELIADAMQLYIDSIMPDHHHIARGLKNQDSLRTISMY